MIVFADPRGASGRFGVSVRSSSLFAIVFCLVSAACGGAVADPAADSGPSDALPTRTPKLHRPTASTCAPSKSEGAGPFGDCSRAGSGSCKSDAECSTGTNGHCAFVVGGSFACNCFYDTCAKDSDCTAGQVCACQGSPFQAHSNSCVAGGCRVDADCGPSGYCSPTPSSFGCGGTLGGYFCHTASDQCIDDEDCPSAPTGPRHCAYDLKAKRWACAEQLICA